MLEFNLIKQLDISIDKYFGTILKFSKINNRIEEDLFSIQLHNYYKAKDNFISNDIKFNTYLTCELSNQRSNYIRDELKHKGNEISVKKEDLVNNDAKVNIESEYIRQELVKIILNEINKLDVKSQKVIKGRLLDNLTFRELSDIIGDSHQYMEQLYKKRISYLREKIKRRIK